MLGLSAKEFYDISMVEFVSAYDAYCINNGIKFTPDVKTEDWLDDLHHKCNDIESKNADVLEGMRAKRRIEHERIKNGSS